MQCAFSCLFVCSRYDGEDCSAPIELKPAKPLPAITSFFKKKEPHQQVKQQSLSVSTADTDVNTGNGGGSDILGAKKRKIVEEEDKEEGEKARAGCAMESAAAVTLKQSPVFPSSPLTPGGKRSRTEEEWGDEGAGNRLRVRSAGTGGDDPSPKKFITGGPTVGSNVSNINSDKRRTMVRTAGGSPSPKKGGSKAGAAAAAAAIRDKKQSKMTAFFGAPGPK